MSLNHSRDYGTGKEKPWRIDSRRISETVRKEEKGQFYQPAFFEEYNC
ncbi:MAG: hypothetical protein NT166_19715 [Candidatus Aminicenantes bacterium]|nr:hypothetical protein [Candidatus Aminicenantes bacterium]